MGVEGPSVADIRKVKQLYNDESNSLNIEKNILKPLKNIVNSHIKVLYKKYNYKFSDQIDNQIMEDIEILRSEILVILEQRCKEIVNLFDADYKQFCNRYGWWAHQGSRTRHQITRDELAYELGEVVRKLYFVYMESKFPKAYQAKSIEEFLLRED